MKRYSLYFFSIIFNFLVYFFIVFLSYQTNGITEWYKWGGDTNEYLCYGENILHGEYRCHDDLINRMPGLPVLYAFFRMFTNKEGSMLMIVLLQVFVGGIAMTMLTKITKRVMNVRLNPRLLVVLFSTLFVYKIFDFVVLTESLAVSSLIFGLYFSLKEQRQRVDYILAGIFFTCCVFLRPYAIIFLALAVVYIIVSDYKKYLSVLKSVQMALLFIIPFIFAEGVWVVRNYTVTERLILFQDNRYAGLTSDSNFEETSYIKLWTWMLTIGEDAVFWNPGSMGSWIYGGEFMPDTFLYKKHMFADSYGEKEIEEVRLLYRAQKDASSALEQDSIQRILNPKIDIMIAAYKRDKLFQYRILAPIRIVKKSFLHSGPIMPVPPWPEIKEYPIHLMVKLYAAISYLMVLFFGFAGIVVLWKKNMETLLMSTMALAVIAALALYLRYTEFRLYTIVFPLLAVFAITFIDRVSQYVESLLRKNKL